MYEEALQSFQTTIDLDPDNVKGKIDLAKVYTYMGQREKSYD